MLEKAKGEIPRAAFLGGDRDYDDLDDDRDNEDEDEDAEEEELEEETFVEEDLRISTRA